MGTKSVSSETKWQAVGMHKTGMSNRAIGRQLGISEKCVRTTLANFKETGDVQDKPRSGAPRQISERDKNTVYRLARQDPNKSVTAIAAELNETLHEASVSYVILRDKNLKSYHAARKPLLVM